MFVCITVAYIAVPNLQVLRHQFSKTTKEYTVLKKRFVIKSENYSSKKKLLIYSIKESKENVK